MHHTRPSAPPDATTDRWRATPQAVEADRGEPARSPKAVRIGARRKSTLEKEKAMQAEEANKRYQTRLSRWFNLQGAKMSMRRGTAQYSTLHTSNRNKYY